MIVRPTNHLLIRILASAFFCFFSYLLSGQSHLQISGSLSKEFEINGLSGQRDHYYRNLMIQDITLPQQLPVDQVRLKMEYHVDYLLKKTAGDTYELTIRSDSIHSQPFYYFGFDISASLEPALADLTFLIVNQFGFLEDSVSFSAVRLNDDAGLYLSKSFQSDINSPGVIFSSIRPVYAPEGYTQFRQDILQIDDYYAAALLLKSVIQWSQAAFPAGEETFLNSFFQQLEISRILNLLGSLPFHNDLTASADPAGYRDLYRRAGLMITRARTIMENIAGGSEPVLRASDISKYAASYSSWIISYEQLAHATNHRYSDFYLRLCDLRLPSSLINQQLKLLRGFYHHLQSDRKALTGIRMATVAAASRFELEADRSREQDDYVTALRWYQNALEICHSMPGSKTDMLLIASIYALKREMAESYLTLARTSASRSTIAVTEGYLEKARELFAELYPESSLQVSALRDFEQQVYSDFCLQAGNYVSAGKYLLALDYLDFLLGKCSECRYECTGDIQGLALQAKTGRYQQLLEIARFSYETGKLKECRSHLSEALEIRLAAGSRIGRDKLEAELISYLQQELYCEYMDEGSRSLNYQHFEMALYYLNKARSLERTYSLQLDPSLSDKLQRAARPLILALIETGRVRAMGYFFTESWEMLHSSSRMIQEYGLENDSELLDQISDLEKNLRNYQCEKLVSDYYEALLAAQQSKSEGDFISAQDKTDRIIAKVLSDTVCSINDQEAWYLRAILEYPAEFMRRQERSLGRIPDDPAGFLTSYEDLFIYYQSMKLDSAGITFMPLFQRILEQADAGFLEAMLDYYYRQRERQCALGVLKRLWQASHTAPSANLQKDLAKWLADEDVVTAGCDPEKCLATYVPGDKAFRTFRNTYKFNFLKYSGWKVRYLSLFLNVKKAEN